MLNRLITKVLPLALGVSNKQHLSILNYHRILPRFDEMRPGETTVNQFDWQMKLVSRYFTPLPLRDALEDLRSGNLPRNAVCVTFDDGYADNAELALPIAGQYGVPLTIFIATGFLNGGRMWNDTIIEFFRLYDGVDVDLRGLGLEKYNTRSVPERLASVDTIIRTVKYWPKEKRSELTDTLEARCTNMPDDLMLCDHQLESLAKAGVEIGAHTVNHPILAIIDDNEAEREILDSKKYLEALLGRQVDYFAYPNGKFDDDYRLCHCDIAERLGFEAALSTNWGVASSKTDIYQLPRFTPWDKNTSRFLTRMFMNSRHVNET